MYNYEHVKCKYIKFDLCNSIRGGKVEANGATFTKMGYTLQEGAHFWVHTSFLGPEGACVM